MLHELLVPPEKKELVEKIIKKEEDFGFFKSSTNDNVVYFLCHGTKEGLLSMKGLGLTLEELLKLILKKDLFKGTNITEVQTISCFGGLQTPCEEQGITVKSFHNSKAVIKGGTVIRDGKCYLKLDIN